MLCGVQEHKTTGSGLWGTRVCGGCPGPAWRPAVGCVVRVRESASVSPRMY